MGSAGEPARDIRNMTALETGDGQLQRVLTDHDTDNPGIYVVYPYKRHVSARLRAFIDYLADAFSHPSDSPV